MPQLICLRSVVLLADSMHTRSDIFSHTRNLATCHLANIAMRLGRKLRWDPARERFAGAERGSAFPFSFWRGFCYECDST